jgi:hypothetical protein
MGRRTASAVTVEGRDGAVVNHGSYAKDSAAHELCAAGSVGENENLGKETAVAAQRSTRGRAACLAALKVAVLANPV